MNKTFKQLGFKGGDVVVCTNSALLEGGYKKGDEFILMEKGGEIYTDDRMEWNGYYGDWKIKEKDMQKFKVGDKVKVIKRTGFFGYHDLDIGGIYKINAKCAENGFTLKATCSNKNTIRNFVHKDEIELYTEDMFEDIWHLNDGKVTIPDDADKLEKDGSVVAFRKRISPKYKFGDILIGRVTETEYRFIKYESEEKKYAILLNSCDEIVQGQKLSNFKRK